MADFIGNVAFKRSMYEGIFYQRPLTVFGRYYTGCRTCRKCGRVLASILDVRIQSVWTAELIGISGSDLYQRWK